MRGPEGADGRCAASAELRRRFAEEVDWAKVVDPYVPGPPYGPDLLERLWSPDRETADAAHTRLHSACCGDGSSVLPAALEVLPFLVEAVRDPAVKVRTDLLETLADLVRAGNNARTAKPDPGLGGWRPTAPAAWPAAWERAVDALLPGLDDDAEEVRAGVAVALARTAGRADDLIDRFRARFEEEPELSVAEELVVGVGELTPHAVERGEEAVVWLRQRMSDAGKGEEPDIDDDTDAWLAWMDQHGHDVRLPAIAALRRALPGRPDPAYARTTADALLTPALPGTSHYLEWRSQYVARVTAADAQLDEDLPGRLALARALLRQDTPDRREAGLRVAATLMSRWRSAVPELLPEVAEFADDPDPENRAFALRVVAMCGAAARPWADRVAAHLTEDDEPHEPARRHAVWALSRLGDERCVPALAAGLLNGRPTGFALTFPYDSVYAWQKSDLNYPEALGPFADHVDTLLGPLLTRASAEPPTERDACYGIVRRWHQDGAPVVEALIERLYGGGSLAETAQVLERLGAGPVLADRRDELRELLGPPQFWPDPKRVDPFAHFALTGDGRPLLTLVFAPGESPFPEVSAQATDRHRVRACTALGPLASDAAGWLREAFQEALREKPSYPSSTPEGAVERARALWRVTGDAEEVVSALLELTANSARKAYATPGDVEPLLLLAEVAATRPPLVDQAAQRLYATARARIEGDRCFQAMEMLRALWQLTRDGRQVAPSVVELVRRCPPGDSWPTIVELVEFLAEIATADPACAAEVAPQVRYLLDTDERPVTHDQWRAVLSDEALLAAVRVVVGAADQRA
ncbi:PBS lyase HEAT-like repeat-containing protein [Streptomyces sp. Ncost-T6T-1]|uniref:HEAT repeat domain-containing protein n=1 Tax=Streptomyces sp. Ncost-T6T-1 TaxID=1100828 RepID=UPI000805FCEF|nr:HEAT repeat domain-containing protein [Streptomyces sp. Ncost-T6T-1]SBV00649.1 PBS lyase HEAT-like repeat-containing protein [Streptomyces sp. Ncost-T6T-1]